MKVTPQGLPEVLLVEPHIFRDERGYFLETFHLGRYEAAGLPAIFVQDNVSRSKRNVIRGLHFQNPNAQGKLVTVLEGEIFDVAVDVRHGSPTFGRWTGVTLDTHTHAQLYVPPGFAHGFAVRSEEAVVSYKCTTVYDPSAEVGVLFSDPDIGIPWGIADPVVSDRDRASLRLNEVPLERLSQWEAPR